MKKVLSIVLSIAMVVCLAPTMAFAATTNAAQSNAAYSDIEGTACEGAVNVLSALKVVDGFTDGTYKPEQTVTRAQMAKLIVTALGVADYATAKTSKYTDMGNAAWAIPYVEYASNLNIVNGVGNNKFNPNGLVTYEQAATMIVRALGYTDQCKEMNGTWPAVYIQKAMALNIFEDVVNGGANGANRGDVAIMLYNALDIAQVYADADGATQAKSGNNDTTYNGQGIKGVTMMGTLNKNGKSAYGTITSTQVDNAKLNIRSYLGAAGKYTADKNGDILALGDIKSTFITGDIKSDEKLDVDGTSYTINDDALSKLNDNGGSDSVSTASGVVIVNGSTTNDVTSTAAIKAMGKNGDKTVTLAAEVSGKTIKHIYSIATWDADDHTAKISDADIAQITKNKKLLSVKFAKDDDNNIDETSFVLNGVSKLSDIKEDNIVYVYENSKNEISRIDVGTKVVTGEVTRIKSDKVTIDGTEYKLATVDNAATNINDISAGDKVTLYLDYDGKIFDYDLDEATTGDYAVLVSANDTIPSKTATASDAKVQLFTADGNATVYNVNGKKYVDNADTTNNGKTVTPAATTWSAVTAAATTKSDVTSKGAFRIVKYSLSDNKISKIQVATDIEKNDAKLKTISDYNASGIKITKSGYLTDSNNSSTFKLADSVKIFAIKLTNNQFDFGDTDDLSVLKRADVLDTDLHAYQAIYNDKSEVVALLIDNNATSEDQFGIATDTSSISVNGSSENGVSFYIGNTEYKDVQLDGNAPSVMDKNTVTSSAVLYKIKKTTSGKYSFDSSFADKKEATTAAGSSVTTAAVYVNKLSSDRVTFAGTNAPTVNPLNIASNVVIYTYDKSDDEITVSDYSSRLDVIGSDVQNITFYKNVDKDSDNYGLVDYIVIYQD